MSSARHSIGSIDPHLPARAALSRASRGAAAARRAKAIACSTLLCALTGLAAVGTGTAGCVLTYQSPKGEKAGPAYSGPECGKDIYAIKNEEDRLATALLCGQGSRQFGYHVNIGMDIEKRHGRFEDRRFNHFSAGLMLLTCAELCEDKVDPMAIGMLEWFARTTDPAQMGERLKDSALSEDLRAAFVERVGYSKKNIAERAAKLDPRRQRMYVEVPNEVRDKRQQYFKKHADLYRRLDAALTSAASAKTSGKGADDVAAKLAALRGEYLGACKAADCRFDPFVTEVTRELVLLHLATKNDLAALVEGALFREKAPDRNAYAPSVHLALYLAMKKETEDHDAYERMKSGGADEATLSARFGAPPPIKVTPEGAFSGRDRATSLTAGLQEKGFVSVAGTVRQVKPAKDGLAEVVFEDNVSTYELTDCVDTNRITGIDMQSGRLIYDQVCRSVGTKTDRQKIAPIFVPAEEVAETRPKELLVALVRSESREGYTQYVRNKEAKMTQFRGHRVDAKLEHGPLFSPLQEEKSRGD